MKIRRNSSKHKIEQAYAKIHLKDSHDDTHVYLVRSTHGGAASLSRLRNLFDSISIQFVHEELDIHAPLSAEYTWVHKHHCTEVIETNEAGLFALHKESSL